MGPMRWRLLAHPYFTGSVLVLAVNDHLLKGRVPSAVTGKLSDFAGVFLLAVAVTVLTGRPRFACCLSGVGFAAITTVPVATYLAAPFLGGATLRDPSDLLSLMMLYPAYRFASRAVPRERERSIPQQVLGLSSAMVAVFAMSATSCARSPSVDAFVVTDDDTVFARVYEETYNAEGEEVPAPRWARSDDGGATWASTAEVRRRLPRSPRRHVRQSSDASGWAMTVSSTRYNPHPPLPRRLRSARSNADG